MKPGIVFLATGAVLVFCTLVAGCTQNLSGYILSPGTSGNPVIDANNRFSFDLYSQLAGDAANKDQNLFFSPWSISSAMAVTYEGARNKTAGKIRNVFHFPENRIVLRDGYASLNSGLNPNNPAYTLRTANALWAEKSWPFLPEYSRIALKSYGAHAENLDFVHDAEGSRNAINSWVGEKTDEKISHLVSPGEITPVTRLIITNGIFFRGTYQAFSLPSGGTIPVRMMARNDRNAFFRYGETDRVQVLEMPYVNGTGTPLSMFILLPRKRTWTGSNARWMPGNFMS
jgi:serpin B